MISLTTTAGTSASYSKRKISPTRWEFSWTNHEGKEGFGEAIFDGSTWAMVEEVNGHRFEWDDCETLADVEEDLRLLLTEVE